MPDPLMVKVCYALMYGIVYPATLCIGYRTLKDMLHDWRQR